MDYSNTYHERLRLENGAILELRPIKATDRAALAEGFRRLSPRSRYRRFLAPKPALDDSELDFFTECDGWNHYAIVAALPADVEGKAEGVGVARFVRSKDDPEVAELAIVVADDWQGKGIGSRLLKRIVAAAGERGIQRVSATALADNEQVRGLLAEYKEVTQLDCQRGIMEFTIPVPESHKSKALEPLVAALRLAAQGLIALPRCLRRTRDAF